MPQKSRLSTPPTPTPKCPPSNRESCTVSRTRTREQTKTRKRNAPSACRSWRRGRTSGRRLPSWGPRPSHLNYPARGGVSACVCGPESTHFATVSGGFFVFFLLFFFCSFKPKGIVISRKTPECLKITALTELLFWHLLSFFFLSLQRGFSALCWYKREPHSRFLSSV